MANRSQALKPQVYVDERPQEFFAPYYAFAREHEIGWLLELARLILVPLCMILYRVRARSTFNVPGSGPAIIAPNHFSTLDHFFVAMYLRRRVRFMAKSQLFRGPLAPILKRVGAFPVRRGKRDEEAMSTALSVLARGGVVVIYPEGGRSRSESLSERAKPGVGRLALESGAPVIPVAIHGSQRARNWRRGQFPAICVRFGEPVRYALADRPEQLGREQWQKVADDVLERIRALWEQIDAERRRKPTERLAALPAGVVEQARKRAEALPPIVGAIHPVVGHFAGLRNRVRRASHPADWVPTAPSFGALRRSLRGAGLRAPIAIRPPRLRPPRLGDLRAMGLRSRSQLGRGRHARRRSGVR
jgi:1-acyl-sn-glycerol-3-phosphate acyltransferase